MKRALSLYLPTWSSDRVKRRWRKGIRTKAHHSKRPDPHNEPVVLLIAHHRGQRVVVGCCQRAMALGVRPGVYPGAGVPGIPGVSLASACAILPGAQIQVEAYRLREDAKALEALALWADRFSPIVAADPPDGLLLDITGCGHLFRGEQRLMNQLVRAVSNLGFHCRAAIAPTFGCAWAVARYGRANFSVVGNEQVRDVLSPLPIRALRVNSRTQETLQEVAVDCIGQLLDLPRNQLAVRFDPSLLQRLDQAMGSVPELVEPIRPVEPVRNEIPFDGATTRHDAMEAATQTLIQLLCDQLRGREAGARRIELVLRRIDATPAVVTIHLSQPSRDAKHLWTLLRPRLERVNLGFGVEHLTLTAQRTTKLVHEQCLAAEIQSGFTEYKFNKSINQLVDVLANRLGVQAVGTIAVTQTHLPEQVFSWTPVELNGVRSPAVPHVIDADRPTVLFDPPQPAEVIALNPEGPPLRLCWACTEHEVKTSLGPERVEQPWWESPNPSSQTAHFRGRDYFKVQDTRGRWLWVYHDLASNRWFVHGQWA